MPWLDREVGAILTAYFRCKDFSALPCAGGIMDQPSSVMESFDVIRTSFEKVRAKKESDFESEMKKKEMSRDLKNGRHRA